MDKLLRIIHLLRFIRDCNRKGIYPNYQQIYKEMDSYLGEKGYNRQLFERDKETIRDEWHYDLRFEDETYALYEDENQLIVDDLLAAYILFIVQNQDGKLPECVITETRQHTGTNHIADCIEAIEAHKELHITYYDYRDEQTKAYTLQPYKLKHKDYKWYVLAVDKQDNSVPFKAFALERVRSLEIGATFRPNKELDFYSLYYNAFGMFTDAKAEKVVLQFDHRDGNYLKASPIHHSQRVIAETETHITFELYVKPTLDFIMELMKRSWSLTILEPTHLRDTFVKYWQEAVKRNLEVR